MKLNEKNIGNLSIDISSNIIEFMSSYGLLKHNQLYDLHYDMDSKKSSKELTIESQAMIQGLSNFIYNYFLKKLDENK